VASSCGSGRWSLELLCPTLMLLKDQLHLVLLSLVGAVDVDGVGDECGELDENEALELVSGGAT
jgi:hypothetical protein